MNLKGFFLCCLFLLVVVCSTIYSNHPSAIKSNEKCRDFVAPVTYPKTWRNENVSESHHGIMLADPYRWLENPYSDETKQFISAQNNLSDSYLKKCDIWPKIHKKLSETYNFKRYTLPQYHGNHYYFEMNTGLQDQNVIYRQKSLDDEPSVFLNPNEMSRNGTFAITDYSLSGDTKMVAYAFSESGADWNRIKIRNIETGKDYPEMLEGVKFSTTSWTSDNKGFFYARYLKYGDGTETDRTEYQKICYHRVGEAQVKDVLVFGFPELPLSQMTASVVGKYLILLLFPNGNPNEDHLYYADLEKHGKITGKIPLKPIYTADLSSEFEFVTMMGSKAAFRTNKNAPNFRVVWIDLENPAEGNWTTLIASILLFHSLNSGELKRRILLYGYGGFGFSQVARFDLYWFFFVNSFDGVLAVANIRGGGEYGTKWDNDGMLFKKQNSFDDFHAAAEYLIENRYTTRNKLAIRGVSNGAILVGACINQRPDLYGAAVAHAGVYDMIRFPLFTYPGVAIPEFGNPEKRADIKNILKYSPLHNVHTPNSTQNQYPATFIVTGDHDDRVSPLHSFKFTATLQHAVQGNKYQTNPILMKLLKDAGHSAGKPTYQLIDLESDILTFLYRALSIDNGI